MSALTRYYFHLLSGLRGFAAILVVLRHTSDIFAPVHFPMSYMAVDLFFLLSGVVLDASYRQRLATGMKPLEFAFMRIVRIYPLYFLGSVLTVLTILLAPGHLLFSGTSPFLIPHKLASGILAVFLLPNLFHSGAAQADFPFDRPAWSLFLELAVNIFYGYIAARLSLRRVLVIAAICGVGLLGYLLFFHHSHVVEMGDSRRTFIGGFFRTGVSFFLGVALYRLYLRHPFPVIGRHSALVSAVVILVVVATLMAAPPGHLVVFFYVSAVFFVFPAMVFIALSVVPSPRIIPLWMFLGDTSYAVYTLHVPVYFFLCSVIAAGWRGTLVDGAPLVGVGFLAVLLGVSYVADRIYDQPVRKWLKPLWRADRPAALAPAAR